MEKILTSEQASMLDQALSLVRKASIINRKSVFIDVWVELTPHNWFEYRVYKKGANDILMWQTVHFDYEFEEKFLTINRVFNYILKYGILPENYPRYES